MPASWALTYNETDARNRSVSGSEEEPIFEKLSSSKGWISSKRLNRIAIDRFVYYIQWFPDCCAPSAFAKVLCSISVVLFFWHPSSAPKIKYSFLWMKRAATSATVRHCCWPPWLCYRRSFTADHYFLIEKIAQLKERWIENSNSDELVLSFFWSQTNSWRIFENRLELFWQPIDDPIFLFNVLPVQSNNQVAVGSELRRGDLLTQINGRSCSEMTHREAVDLIKNAGSTISIVVKRYSLVNRDSPLPK